MSEIKLECRVGFNDDDGWNVQLRVINIDSRDEAKILGQQLVQQFREFLNSRGVTITEDEVKRDTALILPNSVN